MATVEIQESSFNNIIETTLSSSIFGQNGVVYRAYAPVFRRVPGVPEVVLQKVDRDRTGSRWFAGANSIPATIAFKEGIGVFMQRCSPRRALKV